MGDCPNEAAMAGNEAAAPVWRADEAEMKKWIVSAAVLLLIIIVAAVGILAYWQWDNLKALYKAKTMDAEAILAEAAAQTEKRQKELEAYGVTLKVPTRVEMDALLDGAPLPTGEDAASEQPPADPDTDAAEPDGGGTNPTQQPAMKPETEQAADPKELIERCIQELYDCETALMARLGVMKQAAVDEWKSLPDSERTEENKMDIGYRGLDACYELEVEIDAQVLDILAGYRAEPEAVKADTAPMDTLWAHYCEEKTSAKAYYFNKYL